MRVKIGAWSKLFYTRFYKKISNPFLSSHFFIIFATVFGAIAGKALFFLGLVMLRSTNLISKKQWIF
jgi:hypothetical protein